MHLALQVGQSNGQGRASQHCMARRNAGSVLRSATRPTATCTGTAASATPACPLGHMPPSATPSPASPAATAWR